MRKILIRSGMSPKDAFDVPHIMNHNSIGGNVGNLIYAYSLYRALTTENTEVVPDYYSLDSSDKRVKEINETYDCYIIALADAFRTDFTPELRAYTKLIKKLTIPVHVIGVGLRAPFEPNLDEGFPFDEDVKAFVSAVLEKSNALGLRGQITADYLTRLGFVEGRDHVVIGCPSMYAFGRDLTIREPKNISTESVISINSSMLSPKNVLNFLSRTMDEFPDHYFIPQWMKELMLLYTGKSELRKANNYPVSINDPAYSNDRVRFFLNAPTWINFLRDVDLSVGARLHGNITSALAGTPNIIIPKDARMRELAEYHQLTSLWWNDIDENTKLLNEVEKLDFKSLESVQGENFDNFINFLEKNNLEHVYSVDRNRKHVPLDEQLKDIQLLGPAKSIVTCDRDEMIKQWSEVADALLDREGRIKKRKDDQINRLKKRNKYLEGTLNRKSVRFALGFADKFSSKKSK